MGAAMAMDHEKWLEQHDRMMADHEIMWARHEQMWARHEETLAGHDVALARHNEIMARIDRRLDRAVRLAIQDARRHRKRNLEIQETMSQIAAAQQQLMKAFLERGGNGKH
jgi:hypothetical protein